MYGVNNQHSEVIGMVTVTRRFDFSAAHRYWRDDWSQVENERAFGACTSRYGHGHNYQLDVSVKGSADPVTGMVMNVTDLKRIVNDLLEQFDHKHLNEDTPYFKQLIPTTENIVRVLWNLLAPHMPQGVALAKLRLYEMQDLWADYEGEDEATFARSYSFSAAHRLHAQQLSDTENQALFGKCNNPNGHGHNYTLEVSINGQVDPETGMVIDLVEMDKQVHGVIDQLDHKHLDHQIAGFAERTSTAENIVVYLWEQLTPAFEGRLAHLKLWETRKNVFEYYG